VCLKTDMSICQSNIVPYRVTTGCQRYQKTAGCVQESERAGAATARPRKTAVPRTRLEDKAVPAPLNARCTRARHNRRQGAVACHQNPAITRENRRDSVRVRPPHLACDCSSRARISNKSPYPERSGGNHFCFARDGEASFPPITAFRQRSTQVIPLVPRWAMFVGRRSKSRSSSPSQSHPCF
jgi:hypothetical protein